MKKILQLGPFSSGWHWRYVVDGHIVDQGWDEDLKTAKQQARDAIEAYNNLGDGK